MHGGAWRDPQLTSRSIEPTVAHAFSGYEASDPIKAIASMDYTVSHFPSHPSLPYDVSEHSDPSREAVHPQHVSDVLHGLALLRSFGLRDESYILSGHSCGACIAFQAILQSPAYYGLENIADAPNPAALIGLNGLFEATCFAISKRLVEGWSLEDLDRATSPESLSLAADDYRQSMGSAQKWIGAELKLHELVLEENEPA